MPNAPRWNPVDGTGFRPDGVEVSLAPLLELAEETAPDLAAHMDEPPGWPAGSAFISASRPDCWTRS